MLVLVVRQLLHLPKLNKIEMLLLAARMRLVLLASLAVAAAGCRPTYTCTHKSGSPAKSVCHAHWACTFSLCYPGQTCTMPFYLSDGVAGIGAAGQDTPPLVPPRSTSSPQHQAVTAVTLSLQFLVCP